MKVLILVTHLLGTGHLSRALTLGRAMAAAGHQVRLFSGGMPVPHLDRAGVSLIQLSPLRSDGVDFSRLLDGQGNLADPALMAKRQSQLLEGLRAEPPDVVITELFPFGRRSLRDEFSALLECARALPDAPLICASIRDILAPPSKPKKAAYAAQMIDTYYDAVLVHSDAEITPLELSWPVTPALAAKLQYTGFVAPPAAPMPQGPEGRDEILVSAGGGDVGQQLFGVAQAAAQQRPELRWRLLLGGADADARAQALRVGLPANVVVEPARPDFRSLLHLARASVSLCGYNTALDVLQAGCPAVFVPFDAGNEVEQSIRASALAKRPGMSAIKSADLTADRLLCALDALAAEARPAPLSSGLDGAVQTTRILEALHAGRGHAA